VALTPAPLVFAVGLVVALRIRFATGLQSLRWQEMSVIYLGFLASPPIAQYFSRPIIDPNSRWAIFAARQRRWPCLWMLMVLVALLAPDLALTTFGMREIIRTHEAFNAHQLVCLTAFEHEFLGIGGSDQTITRTAMSTVVSFSLRARRMTTRRLADTLSFRIVQFA
jgi:hypothetical protein